MELGFRFLSRVVFLFAILFIGVLSGCDKDKVYPDPEIEFITEDGYVFSDTTLALNESFKIGLKMSSQSDQVLTHFSKTIDRDGDITSIDTALAVMEYISDIIIDKSLAASEIWSFYCRDRDSRKSEVISLTINLDTSSVYGKIKYVPSLTLGAQNNNETGSFYSFSKDENMSMTDAFASQEDIDLAYYYDTEEGDKNTLASPGANISELIFSGAPSPANWTIKNTTRFVKAANVSSTEFEGCKNDSLILANTFDFSSGKRKAKKLAADHVYSFVTESGEKGLFLVKGVVGEAEGSIEIAIKMLDE